MIYCTSTHKQVQCRKFVKTYRHKTLISPWQCLKETKTKPPLQISFLFIIYLTYNNVSFEQWNGKWKDVGKLAPFESEKFAHEKSPLQGSLPKFLSFFFLENRLFDFCCCCCCLCHFPSGPFLFHFPLDFLTSRLLFFILNISPISNAESSSNLKHENQQPVSF